MAKVKPIFVIGTGQEFKSASAAAKALGINRANIYSVLSGRRKSAGGKQFGYAENRAVLVTKNGTGKVYSSLTSAARSVGANISKVENIVTSGIDKTVKGYQFQYVDKSKLTPSAPSVPKMPKGKKQRRAEKREKRKVREREKKKSVLNPYIKKYKEARKELSGYITVVNKQIDKYNKANPALIYYHPATPSVFGLQMYTGYNGMHFDETLKKLGLPEEPTKEDIEKLTEKMKLLYERLKAETNQKKRNFFDMHLAEQNRTQFADEFFKTPGHENDLDKYAEYIWDIIEILQRANLYPELGSDKLFIAIQDAMQGNVDSDTLSRFIDSIAWWMDNDGSQEELNEYFMSLDDSYTPTPGYSVFDDEEGWFMW